MIPQQIAWSKSPNSHSTDPKHGRPDTPGDSEEPRVEFFLSSPSHISRLPLLVLCYRNRSSQSPQPNGKRREDHGLLPRRDLIPSVVYLCAFMFDLHIVMACAASPASVTRPSLLSQFRHSQSASFISVTGVPSGILLTACSKNGTNPSARRFILLSLSSSVVGTSSSGVWTGQDIHICARYRSFPPAVPFT